MACEIRTVSVRAEVAIPLDGGSTPDFVTFNGFPPGREHFALRFAPCRESVPTVRIHSECITGDLFGSQRCDCGAQLQEALEMLSREGGYLLYLRQEGRGIGLYNKLDAYLLQQQGLDTYAANRHLGFPADRRDYACAADMLKAMDATRIRLLTNNPEKAAQLAAYGIQIDEVKATRTFATPYNRNYLAAKARLTGHSLVFAEPDTSCESRPRAGANGMHSKKMTAG